MSELNPEGMNQVMGELYALNDELLLEEAQQVCSDFKSWLTNKFTVTDQQMEYLDGVPEKVLFMWGAQLAALLVARTQIEIFGPPQTFRTKQTDMESQSKIRHIPGQPPQVEMSASIEFIQP
ncbi:hypothetical protein KZP23_04730 [Echinicola marina]|uniref:hypothetical protein n=1 Tax=Echinicola marina TaxID=2859768 RepID=UPI001CF6F0BC|nr:hypothetical protein [Echinicola marina]UCS94338.1 hypothetical protein KZP23_04730 [Echinicola marina]